LLRPGFVAFASAFAAFLLVAALQGEQPFYYDSGNYWALSETFVKDGHFSLLNFENSDLRGYALPLVYFAIRNAGEFLGSSDAVTVMFFNAAIFALIGAVLAPRLAQVIWPAARFGVWRRLALCALLMVFWRGYLNYPLSDFPALAAALLALCAVGSSRSAPSLAVAGASAALAMEIRPAFFLLIPAVILFALWSWRQEGSSLDRTWLARAAAMAAAIAIVLLPQSLAQHEHFDGYTPVPGGSKLVGLQYTVGLLLQRYDTYVGGKEDEAQMNYLDLDTEGIIEGLDNGEVKDTGEYAKLIAENPVTMAGVFVRHLFNGLDARYTTPYVGEIEDGSNRPLRFAGFLLVFIALVRLAWPRMRRQLGSAQWRFAVALVLLSATSVASAVETRFLLPVFLFAAMVAVAPGWQAALMRRESRGRRLTAAAAILASAIVFFTVAGLIVRGATDSLVLGIDPDAPCGIGCTFSSPPDAP
jgi:hypothetical protein